MSVAQESEFAFELRVCQWVERHWPPGGPRDDRTVLVARQLGIRERRWDTIVLECDPAPLRARARFGNQALDSDLLHVVRHAPPDWGWYRDVLPEPEYPWRYVREAVHRAADRELIEERSGSNGRIELRRKWQYPEFVSRVIAIENKPDLDASAARSLAPQIERDVALGLADEVWIATGETGSTVSPALFEDVPVEAGVLSLDTSTPGPSCEAGTVEWHPRTLDPSGIGTRIVSRPGGTEHDASAARFEYADPDWKAAKRREIAERAYERGWRNYVETMRQDCRHYQLSAEDGWVLPRCGAKGRVQTAAECRSSCPEISPEPPAWRQLDWPLDGGPGAAIKRLLEQRRARRRPE